MTKSMLLGRHTHQTSNGVRLNIFLRDGRYLARGYFDRRPFGKTLGQNEEVAESALCRLRSDIENGRFIRPSEAAKLPFIIGQPPQLDVRELSNRFIAFARKKNGQRTARTYEGRLVPVIEFAELPRSRQCWPNAASIDESFAVESKSALMNRHASRNGHPVAQKRPISSRQVHNILSCASTMLNWAKQPSVNLLPSWFVNPFTHEIIGRRAQRDPLAPPTLPMDVRVELVRAMDCWQIYTLIWPFILPLRPEDFAGLLISDVDRKNQLFKFVTRLGGDDFNKGRMSFRVPYPQQLVPMIDRCADSRADGPLLQRRSNFEKRCQA